MIRKEPNAICHLPPASCYRFYHNTKVTGSQRNGRRVTGHIKVLHRLVLYQILRRDPWPLALHRRDRATACHGPTRTLRCGASSRYTTGDWHVFRQLKVGGFEFSLKKMGKFASGRDETEKRNAHWSSLSNKRPSLSAFGAAALQLAIKKDVAIIGVDRDDAIGVVSRPARFYRRD